MSDIDDADIDRYLYGGGAKNGAKKNAKISKYDDEEEVPVARAEPPVKSKKQSKQKVSFLVEEDEDDEPKKQVRRKRAYAAAEEEDNEPPPDTFIEQMAKQGKQFTLPIGRNPNHRGRKISVRAKLAARALVEQAQNLRLTSDTRQELQMLLDCPDDGTQIDPMVTLYTRVPTGTCVIYLKESVPVSILLKAIALNATFFVQVTGKAKTQPESFSKVNVKPCKEIKDTLDVQTFDVERIVNELMEENGYDEEQVKAYMYTIGPVSSYEASDLDFIETHVERVKEIFKGQLVVLKESKLAKKGMIEEDE